MFGSARQPGSIGFVNFAMPTISVNQGLSIAAVDVLQATSDGSIWIATADGLNRWQDGHMTIYGQGNVQRQNGRTDQQAAIVNARVTEVANSGLRNKVNSLGQDDLGRLWAESREGVFYFERGRFVQVPGLPGGDISSIAGDGHGKVWISNFEPGPLLFDYGGCRSADSLGPVGTYLRGDSFAA